MARYYGPTLVVTFGPAGARGSISHPVALDTVAEVVGRLRGVVDEDRHPRWFLHGTRPKDLPAWEAALEGHVDALVLAEAS